MARQNPLSLIYERMLTEAVTASDQEYYDAVEHHYDSKLVQMLKSQDKMASGYFGAPIETYKTNDGSMIVRYIDSEEVVAVLGIVAVPGIEKTDYMKDLFSWIDQVISKLEEGKTLTTSPNKLSEPLLKQIIKKAERKGVKLSVASSGTVHTDAATGQQWSTWMISPD
jgi:hypothetical protein